MNREMKEEMEVKATAKTVRIAPRNVRLVIDLIRGKDCKEGQYDKD